MARIVSKRGRPEPKPAAPAPAPAPYNPRIIVNPDGSWSFPTGSAPAAPADPDEEVLRRTTDGVDVNYINMEDC